MIRRSYLTAFVATAALSLFAAKGCRKSDPIATPSDAAAATDASAAMPRTGRLLAFFPPEGKGGYAREVLADVDNYAEARLTKDGNEIAFLAIAEADKLPYVKAKFERATDKVDGFPMMNVGKVQTAALVGERFQVKVTSQVLDEKGRAELLASFDLKRLAAAPASLPEAAPSGAPAPPPRSSAVPKRPPSPEPEE